MILSQINYLKSTWLCYKISFVATKLEKLCYFQFLGLSEFFTAALALRSRGLVIGSREKEEKEEEKEREEEEEKNIQIAIRCLWDLFD